MTTRKLIERIEGEATVDFDLDAAGTVRFASIRFPHIRGMERILSERSALDALVITPRTCGICGHSHLMAAVTALESVYKNAGRELELTPKARLIRETTLMLELVQNHFKWFYLVVYPELCTLLKRPAPGGIALRGAYAAATANRALSLFSGQWPHSSYAIPGGVTCDPTRFDLERAEAFVDEVTAFFETQFAGVPLEHFLVFKSCKEFNALDSDMARVERMLTEASMHEKGFGHDRFMVLGEHAYAHASKCAATVARRVDSALVELHAPYVAEGESRAFNACYRGEYYETGPLARAMSMGYPLIKSMHRRFKDSAYSRINARLHEIGQLLYRIRQHLRAIDPGEASYIPPRIPLRDLGGEGEGIVEAPRGPLIHRVSLKRGKIADYTMITPTQWNLASAAPAAPGAAQQAMRGASGVDEAAFVFRSFDVCSVCTTH